MKKLISIFIISFLLYSCASWRKNLIACGGFDEAMQNAITDFAYTERGEECVYELFTIPSDNKFYPYDGEVYYRVYITTALNPVFCRSKEEILDVVGIKGEGVKFPTGYVERNGKLFLWYDSNIPVTEGLVEALLKYKHVDSISEPYFRYTDLDENGREYYFYKDDLLNYKKMKME